MEEVDEKYCVLLPAYGEGEHIAEVVAGIQEYCSDVIVIDDGSKDNTIAEAEKTGAIVLRHEKNRGKGAALETGFTYVKEHGYTFVITMDSDGQHAPDDIPVFVEEYQKSNVPVIIGDRMGRDDSVMPFVRKCTNKFMSWLLSREMGQKVPDTQSGFRLYHVNVLGFLKTTTSGYAAESECLLRLSAHGSRIGSVPIKVIYHGAHSDIHPFGDTIRFFKMLKKWRSEKRERLN
ncbi:MAG: glycosyltransferase family 2 protein [Kiritimatiellae bacterium]|nr:glycosyltransferase family 2 protein [Kiritimatiellia bacterium]